MPYKVIEQILLKTVLRHLENVEAIDDSQLGFTKGRLCLIDLVAFSYGVIALVDKGKQLMLTICTCVKPLTVKRDVFINKFERCGFDGWAI